MKILTISTGKIAPLSILAGTNAAAREVLSAIRKSPVSTLENPQPIEVRALGLVGDEQAEQKSHGGRDKAVYAYPVEHYPIWQTVCMQAVKRLSPLPHGSFGENLTITGLLESGVWIGDVLVFGGGEVRMRVTSPRVPCFKFNTVMGFPQASQIMNQSGFTGFYLEVMQGETLCAGDAIELLPGARQIRVEELHRMNTGGQ